MIRIIILICLIGLVGLYNYIDPKNGWGNNNGTN